MQIKLSKDTITGMIVKYYKDTEDLDVNVYVTVGDVYSSRVGAPKHTIHFDCISPIYNVELGTYPKLPLENMTIEGIIKANLESHGYTVSDISFTIDRYGRFIGASVEAEKLELENGHTI